MFETFSMSPVTLTFWVKVIFTCMFWKALSHTTYWPSFMTLVQIVSEKLSMFQFWHFFHVSCDLDLWVKVIFTCMFWKVLSHTTHWPSFITVVLIVSEKLSMFKFGTDGRTTEGQYIGLTLLTREPKKQSNTIEINQTMIWQDYYKWYGNLDRKNVH